jgi:hypothetical protein
MALDIDQAGVPSDPKAALGYAELHALWKADKEAFDQGRHISDDAYLIWMMQVRMHLTQEGLRMAARSRRALPHRTGPAIRGIASSAASDAAGGRRLTARTG